MLPPSNLSPMRRPIFVLRWRACAAIFALALIACARGPCVAIVAPGGKEVARVRVEVADTASERETGLMYRSHLDEDAGMIFVFREPSRLSFWMKNTEIPLDMIFADADGKIVGIVANAAPYTLTPRAVDADASYVLEVNGGFAARHHVAAGDKLIFSGFTPQTSE
ncbi:MAG: DUF192 domain-containing protein [Candidatus Binataceae bacterium]